MVRSSHRLHLLGSFQIESVDPVVGSVEFIHLPRRKVEALLAYLVLNPQAHSREKIAALFWGDFSDAQARASLRNALAVLRKELGETVLLTEHDLIQINPNYPLWVDVRDFESHADIEAIIALYRGDLLTDFYDDWILPFRHHYRELYLNILLKMTQEYRAQSEYERAIWSAQKILENDPANERAYQHLMFCYMASGNRQAALEQYGKAEHALRDEFEVEPAPETKALYVWIKQTPSEIPSLAARITNLPIPLTSFIGRKQETREVKKLLNYSRLLTLTGAGGSGKTRLVIQVATDLIDKFKDGVWWVDLSPLMDESLVPQTVAKSLGVREVANQSLDETLTNYLQRKQLLLVIDNCEHLIEACAKLSNHLLTQCPNLQILSTSREPLNTSGETVWRVPTLSVPEKEKL
ncbi:MAG: NB-ARC domain-containing protein, partial [Anaerolineae bacterium]|nr:NB-ARC domain-containing protein [Anaerolineae bacterium]